MGDNDESDIRMEVCAPRAIAWAVEVEDEVSGLVVATEEPEPDYRSVELDIFLAAPLHGRGLGADALAAALRHLFGERDHHRAVIAPAAANERAIRCYQRVGFRPVGMLRQATGIRAVGGVTRWSWTCWQPSCAETKFQPEGRKPGCSPVWWSYATTKRGRKMGYRH